ncbi:MAG: ABC transporter permease, partial [Planctomycetota bacterium]|nr:ABC transporter permease [Planctomycetota bacterium]
METRNETVYTPESPLKSPIQLLKTIFSENWARRGLCAQLFKRNIKSQYRQTFLGLLWVFLPAIASAAIWIFLHSFRVVQFQNELEHSTYLAHVVTGMFFWQS